MQMKTVTILKNIKCNTPSKTDTKENNKHTFKYIDDYSNFLTN